MPQKVSKRKAANGYTLPDPLPSGLVFTDIKKKQFRIGKSIGVGGFGEIYLASENVSRSVASDSQLAIKVEPHANGPLFVEMNFYIRCAKPEDVEKYKQSHPHLENFGMPVLRGVGSHHHRGTKYRFLVMDRFGKDLQKIFVSGKRRFTDCVSYNLALKIIDVLEYIHSTGYCHNDIKLQNLLLGHGRTKENTVYLVDFGLVSKYLREGVHFEYKPDARKAHDGTLEYTSRDAHIGAHSRRSDLEILGYNLVHWMTGDLPWMGCLENPEAVHGAKKAYMADIPAFMQWAFKSVDYPDVICEYMKYVASLDFDTEPDYDGVRKMFRDALSKKGYPLDGKLNFCLPPKASPVKKGRKRKAIDLENCDLMNQDEPCRKSTRKVKTISESENSPNVTSNNSRSAGTSTSKSKTNWSWEKVLISDPESIMRQASRHSEHEEESALSLAHKELEEHRQRESMRNPTDAMKEILNRIEERERERQAMSWSQQLQHLTKKQQQQQQKSSQSQQWTDLTPNPLTPAMEEVIRMRQKRISVEIDIPITPEPSDDDTDISNVSSVSDLGNLSSLSDLSEEDSEVGLSDNESDSDSDLTVSDVSDVSTSESSEDEEENIPLSEMLKRRKSTEATKAVKSVDLNKRPVSPASNEAGAFGKITMSSYVKSLSQGILPSANKSKSKEVREAFKTTLDSPLKQFDNNDDDQVFKLDEVFKPVPVPVTKVRRVSIQNDAAPIRNKDSPEDVPKVLKPPVRPDQSQPEGEKQQQQQPQVDTLMQALRQERPQQQQPLLNLPDLPPLNSVQDREPLGQAFQPKLPEIRPLDEMQQPPQTPEQQTPKPQIKLKISLSGGQKQSQLQLDNGDTTPSLKVPPLRIKKLSFGNKKDKFVVCNSYTDEIMSSTGAKTPTSTKTSPPTVTATTPPPSASNTTPPASLLPGPINFVFEKNKMASESNDFSKSFDSPAPPKKPVENLDFSIVEDELEEKEKEQEPVIVGEKLNEINVVKQIKSEVNFVAEVKSELHVVKETKPEVKVVKVVNPDVQEIEPPSPEVRVVTPPRRPSQSEIAGLEFSVVSPFHRSFENRIPIQRRESESPTRAAITSKPPPARRLSLQNGEQLPTLPPVNFGGPLRLSSGSSSNDESAVNVNHKTGSDEVDHSQRPSGILQNLLAKPNPSQISESSDVFKKPFASREERQSSNDSLENAFANGFSDDDEELDDLAATVSEIREKLAKEHNIDIDDMDVDNEDFDLPMMESAGGLNDSVSNTIIEPPETLPENSSVLPLSRKAPSPSEKPSETAEKPSDLEEEKRNVDMVKAKELAKKESKEKRLAAKKAKKLQERKEQRKREKQERRKKRDEQRIQKALDRQAKDQAMLDKLAKMERIEAAKNAKYRTKVDKMLRFKDKLKKMIEAKKREKAAAAMAAAAAAAEAKKKKELEEPVPSTSKVDKTPVKSDKPNKISPSKSDKTPVKTDKTPTKSVKTPVKQDKTPLKSAKIPSPKPTTSASPVKKESPSKFAKVKKMINKKSPLKSLRSRLTPVKNKEVVEEDKKAENESDSIPTKSPAKPGRPPKVLKSLAKKKLNFREKKLKQAMKLKRTRSANPPATVNSCQDDKLSSPEKPSNAGIPEEKVEQIQAQAKHSPIKTSRFYKASKKVDKLDKPNKSAKLPLKKQKIFKKKKKVMMKPARIMPSRNAAASENPPSVAEESKPELIKEPVVSLEKIVPEAEMAKVFPSAKAAKPAKPVKSAGPAKSSKAAVPVEKQTEKVKSKSGIQKQESGKKKILKTVANKLLKKGRSTRSAPSEEAPSPKALRSKESQLPVPAKKVTKAPKAVPVKKTTTKTKKAEEDDDQEVIIAAKPKTATKKEVVETSESDDEIMFTPQSQQTRQLLEKLQKAKPTTTNIQKELDEISFKPQPAVKNKAKIKRKAMGKITKAAKEATGSESSAVASGNKKKSKKARVVGLRSARSTRATDVDLSKNPGKKSRK